MSEFFGPYELIKPLASGGMGRVYLALNTGPEGFRKQVVVKTILPRIHTDERLVTMFMDEARIAAQLHHPNICHTFDFGRMNDTYYLAMEYVPGVSVARLLEDCRRVGVELPWPLACRLVIDAAAGLHYAHEAKDDQGRALRLIHRDVSPQNILVGNDGGVKLIDFGIARAAGRSTQTTASGTVRGKFAYMPPEQAEGREIDRRSDIFSLGVVLHELLTGRDLFARGSDAGTLRAALDCDVPPPSSLEAGLPPAIDALVMKALARDPDQRYSTARELAFALESFLLDHRAPASGLALVHFMEELYPNRGVMPAPEPPSALARENGSESGPPSPREAATRPLRPGGPGAPRPGRRMIITGGLVLAGVAAMALVVAVRPDTHAPSAERVPAATPPPLPRLWVTTEPAGVEVLLDGTLLGKTPLSGHEVSRLPRARITLRGPGLVVQEMMLPLEQDQRLEVQMKRESVEIELTSTPPGAQVKMGSQVLGKTPLVWRTESSTRPVSLTFALAGFEPTIRQVAPASATSVQVDLKKRARRREPEPAGTLWETR